jgi:hypothetical protein
MMNTNDVSLPLCSQQLTQGAIQNVEAPNAEHECQNVQSGEKLVQSVRFL